MLRRFGFFFLTQFLVMATILTIINLLGIKPYITQSGLDIPSLLSFCFIFGMTGSIISLLMSRWMAKKTMGVHVIDPKNPGEFAGLLQSVHTVCRSASLSTMPEVGVYESDEINAFATGPSKSRSLVAFSTGILRSMNKDELDGVIAHEVAHIKNGDMVTMALLQGIMNAFVMVLARLIAFGVSQAVPEERRALVNMLVTLVLDIALTFLGHLVVSYFSRVREYRADAGAGSLVGKEKMVAALKLLQRRFEPLDVAAKSLETAKIASGKSSLFSTHPSLESRIAALQA